MKRILRKILKITLYALGVIVLFLVVVYFILNKPLPEGKEGPLAQEIAKKVQKAVNIEAWNDLGWVSWSFPRGHDHVWDKQAHLAEVKWDKVRVLLNPTKKTGKVYQNGKEIAEGEEKEELIQQAFRNFSNDSFWMCAFTKLDDPGTALKTVETEDRGTALMITYNQGGVTPGDSYLWFVDENYRPTAWQMWVDIIPVGGLEFTWTDWKQLYNGAWVPGNHENFLFDVPISNIKSGKGWQELGLKEDIFADLR